LGKEMIKVFLEVHYGKTQQNVSLKNNIFEFK